MSATALVSQNLLINGLTDQTTTWAALPDVQLTAPAALLSSSNWQLLEFLWGQRNHPGEILIANPSRVDSNLQQELTSQGFDIWQQGETTLAVTTPATQLRSPEPGRVWLLTSGSTGRPKQVGHTLASLNTVRGELPPRRWLCPYAPGSYAWWQVVSMGLQQPQQDILFIDHEMIADWVPAAIKHQVTAASGTPTFWRQSVQRFGAELAKVPFQQITLGGEPVDQSILTELAQLFPAARISWIYASSELGASIVVHDGKAGFPASWLAQETPGKPKLSVLNDELIIDSPFHAAGLAGPVPTGDKVRQEGDRVVIVGRVNSDEINVGGAKVSASQIRDLLQTHPAVSWASVYPRKAPLLGNVVAAKIVLADPGADWKALQSELRDFCAARLPEYAVPRSMFVLPEIPSKETLKSDV